LNNLNDENLFRIHRLEKEVIENREHEMLTNVYKFSEENPYKEAILFIGSGHRKSIFNLIKKYQAQNALKLNWVFYNN
jgi:pheromone shutdown protein TraB